MADSQSGGINASQLFIASCISLVTTSMVFATRGAITGPMSADFHLSNEQIGLIYGPSFWGFTIAIFVCGLLVDWVGMKVVHALSSIGYLAGLGLVLFAPRPELADGAVVEGIFKHSGTIMLYAGFLIMGLSQGLVEGVINPLIATIHDREKSKRLNMLHAWWPGGLIIGGLACVALGDASWQVKLGLLAIPSTLSLILIVKNAYPATETAAASVTTGDMIGQMFRPLFILLFMMMVLTASTELGPDQWFGKVMGDITGWKADGILFLCYTAGLMFVLRFFFSDVVHKFSPFLVLTICSVLSFVGLYWLGHLDLPAEGQKASTTAILTAFAAATIFGIGKTYFWPTMLGITSELFPKGGALLMNLMGGVGMLAIALVLPYMGGKLDAGGAGAALRAVSVLPIILFVVFLALHLGFQAKGGYKAKSINHD